MAGGLELRQVHIKGQSARLRMELSGTVRVVPWLHASGYMELFDELAPVQPHSAQQQPWEGRALACGPPASLQMPPAGQGMGQGMGEKAGPSSMRGMGHGASDSLPGMRVGHARGRTRGDGVGKGVA